MSACGVCAPARPCARLPCARLSLSSRMFPRCHSAALGSHTRAPPRLPLSAAPSVPPSPPPGVIDPAALAPGGGGRPQASLPPVRCCRVLLGTQVLLGIGLCRCLIPPGIPGGAGWTAQTSDSRGLFAPKVSAERSAGVRWGRGGGRCRSWAWGPSPSLLGSVPAGTAALPPTWGQWLGLDSGPDIWAAEGHREL